MEIIIITGIIIAAIIAGVFVLRHLRSITKDEFENVHHYLEVALRLLRQPRHAPTMTEGEFHRMSRKSKMHPDAAWRHEPLEGNPTTHRYAVAQGTALVRLDRLNQVFEYTLNEYETGEFRPPWLPIPPHCIHLPELPEDVRDSILRDPWPVLKRLDRVVAKAEEMHVVRDLEMAWAAAVDDDNWKVGHNWREATKCKDPADFWGAVYARRRGKKEAPKKPARSRKAQ